MDGSAPPNKPSTEHNLDLKIVYNDSDLWGKDGGFALKPYVDIFYAISNNRWGYRDLEHARQVLGFVPQDAAEEHR